MGDGHMVRGGSRLIEQDTKGRNVVSKAEELAEGVEDV